MINQMSKSKEMSTPLTYLDTCMVIKKAYNPKHSRMYNSFNATEKQECMFELMNQQIDFEQFLFSGVILDHFPLHRGNNIELIHDVFNKFYFKISKAFLWGNFDKYMHPLNMIKNYYGENYAFELAFLVHYQAWLSLPTILGMLLFIYQVFRFI